MKFQRLIFGPRGKPLIETSTYHSFHGEHGETCQDSWSLRRGMIQWFQKAREPSFIHSYEIKSAENHGSRLLLHLSDVQCLPKLLSYRVEIVLYFNGVRVIDESHDVNEEKYKDGPTYVGHILSTIVDIVIKAMQSEQFVTEHLIVDILATAQKLEEVDRLLERRIRIRKVCYQIVRRIAE